MFRPVYFTGRIRSLHVVASFIVFFLLLSTTRYYRSRPRPPSIYDYTDGKTKGTWLNETNDLVISDEAAYLKQLVAQYGLSKNVPWFSRRVRPTYRSKSRSSMTHTSLKFMPHDFQRVRTDAAELELSAEKSIQLDLSKSATPDQIDASTILFGISASYNRLTYSNDSLMADWARWLTDGKGRTNGAGLVVTLHEASNAEISYVSTKLREFGIDAVVLSATKDLGPAMRYVELIRLLSQRTEELAKDGQRKEFLALLDDDVFFPSLGKLLEKLKRFDTQKELYIGMPSERADWTVENDVTMTYGGGAVLFTVPMATRLATLPCLQRSALTDSAKDAYWDELLYSCVAEHTNDNLHVLPSFYVPEDDYYGLRTGYEGGVQPLALHHYRHRHRFAPRQAHLITNLCGEACFLQRFWFRDHWVLVNGHTISQYPDGAAVLPLRKSSLLATQQEEQQLQLNSNKKDAGPEKDKQNKQQKQTSPSETHTSARLIITEPDGRAEREVVSWTGVKRTWRLLDARETDGGEIWQAYVKRRGSPVSYGDDDDRLPDDSVHTQEGPSDVDSIIVLIWEP